MNDEERDLRALRRGSETALQNIIERYTPYVTAVITNIIGTSMDMADVEEAAADVFYVLWENSARVRPGALRSWLGGVARNTAKRRLRERGKELPLEDDLVVIDPQTPEQMLDRSERDRAVRLAVLSMGQPDREIFLRHYFHGQSVENIAAEMHMPSNTVKSRLRRGREKLKSALIAQLEETGGIASGIQNLGSAGQRR